MSQRVVFTFDDYNLNLPNAVRDGIEIHIDGKCNCGRSVTKILDSTTQTLYTNGENYIYPERPGDYSIFRCDVCSSVIMDSWEPTSD